MADTIDIRSRLAVLQAERVAAQQEHALRMQELLAGRRDTIPSEGVAYDCLVNSIDRKFVVAKRHDHASPLGPRPWYPGEARWENGAWRGTPPFELIVTKQIGPGADCEIPLECSFGTLIVCLSEIDPALVTE